MQRCKITLSPTSAGQGEGPDCPGRCPTSGAGQVPDARSPHRLQPPRPCSPGGDPRRRYPGLARRLPRSRALARQADRPAPGLAVEPRAALTPHRRSRSRRMRHPWLVSTVAAAAVLVTLTGFTPPLAAEGTGMQGFDSPIGGPPPDFCEEGYAHQSGYLAYLQARLQLTADEQTLWNQWQQKLQAAALAERTDCQALRANQGSHPNAIQRED